MSDPRLFGVDSAARWLIISIPYHTSLHRERHNDDLVCVIKCELWSTRHSCLQRLGFTRLLVAGQVVRLDAEGPLPAAETPIEVLVDRLVVQADRRARLLDSLEQALRFGQGLVMVHFPDGAHS